jgi:hypothetical protein
MAAPKVMSGARAKMGIYDPSTGLTRVVGLFNNVSYNMTYEGQPAYILGRYSAAEYDYTSMDVISITASGFRVIDHGPYVDAALPKLQDLLLSEYISLTIIDRQREAQGLDGRIAIFKNVRVMGFNTTLSARNLEEVTVNFVALTMDDESTINAESAGSADLP